MRNRKNSPVMLSGRGLVVNTNNVGQQIVLTKTDLGNLSRPGKFIAVDVAYNNHNSKTVVLSVRKPTRQEIAMRMYEHKNNEKTATSRVYSVTTDGRCRIKNPNYI